MTTWAADTPSSAVNVNWDPTAVIDYRHRIVDVDRDIDLVAMAGERFVDGVVDDFVDEMMQTHLSRRADVHGGSEAYRFQTFQHFDTGRIVNFVHPGIQFIWHRQSAFSFKSASA
jgi:hypothetical protein